MCINGGGASQTDGIGKGLRWEAWCLWRTGGWVTGKQWVRWVCQESSYSCSCLSEMGVHCCIWNYTGIVPAILLATASGEGVPKLRMCCTEIMALGVVRTKCLCPPPIFTCWSPNLQCDGIWKHSFWKVTRSWEWSPHEWADILQQSDRSETPSP